MNAHEAISITCRSEREQHEGKRFTYRVASVRCRCGAVVERRCEVARRATSAENRQLDDAYAIIGAVAKFGWHLELSEVAS